MSKDLIRYDLLVQDALKGMVRKVLGDAARDGLPGDHHFYISFRTDFPGVRLSPRLREKYPHDMTIVLQHQFWDLSISEQVLEVGLSFSGVPERLSIPLDALTGFFDPSAEFGLKFEIEDKPALKRQHDKPARAPAAVPIEAQGKKTALPATGRAPKVPAKQARPEADRASSKGEKPVKPQKVARGDPLRDIVADDTGAEVVSLDAFRKKN
jgi:hypothetical protein